MKDHFCDRTVKKSATGEENDEEVTNPPTHITHTEDLYCSIL